MKHRKLKTCLLLVCIPVLVLVFYALLDFKPMPFIAQYRLAEKAAMVGPGEILGVTTIKPNLKDRTTFYDLIVARTEHGVVLYDGNLSYRKDLGEGIIFLAAASDKSSSHPLVLFDKYPEAVRAELEITITHDIYNTFADEGKRVKVEAIREQNGYFVFLLDSDSRIDQRKLISFTTGGNSYTSPIPVLLYLYNEEGKRIFSSRWEILSPGTIAHRERGEDYPGHDLG